MAAKKETAEIVKSESVFDVDSLASIKSFDDALALVSEKLGGESEIQRASEVLGDGFKLLDSKDKLIGVPILLVTWDFHNGDHGEFVSVKLITKEGDKYIVNDGSTGIRDQLMQYTSKTNKSAGLFCDQGLRRSTYEYTDTDGKKKPATTYYLDTSAS